MKILNFLYFSERHSAVFDSTDEEDVRKERHLRAAHNHDATDSAKPRSHVRSAVTKNHEKLDNLKKEGEENSSSAQHFKNKFEKENTNSGPIKVCNQLYFEICAVQQLLADW